jgi:hypothetical protein
MCSVWTSGKLRPHVKPASPTVPCWHWRPFRVRPMAPGETNGSRLPTGSWRHLARVTGGGTGPHLFWSNGGSFNVDADQVAYPDTGYCNNPVLPPTPQCKLMSLGHSTHVHLRASRHKPALLAWRGQKPEIRGPSSGRRSGHRLRVHASARMVAAQPREAPRSMGVARN